MSGLAATSAAHNCFSIVTSADVTRSTAQSVALRSFERFLDFVGAHTRPDGNSGGRRAYQFILYVDDDKSVKEAGLCVRVTNRDFAVQSRCPPRKQISAS